MSEPSLQSVQLQGWFQRIRTGDLAARDELLRVICGRHGAAGPQDAPAVPQHPPGRRHRRRPQRRPDAPHGHHPEDRPIPPTTRDFFGLAAEHVRRELLDLARHYGAAKRRGSGRRLGLADSDESGDDIDVPDRADDADDLERWAAFHEAVAQLPAEEREVIGLSFYHGWTQADIAQVLQVSDRTVRRYWQSAVLRLGEALGGELPEP